MQSLKSTFVAVLLFGLSVGLYQVSDTSKSMVDESLIPAMDISDGSDLLVDNTTPATVNLPNAFEQTAPKVLTPPKLVSSPITKPEFSFQGGSTAKAPTLKVPTAIADPVVRVPAPTTENVQSFKYPELVSSAKDATLAAVDDFRERQVLDKDRDQDLIDALEEQLQQKPTNEFSGDVIAAKIEQTPVAPPAPEVVTPEIKSEGRYQFASTEPVKPVSAKVQPSEIDNGFDISLTDSEPDLSSITLSAAWPHVDRLVDEGRYRDSLKLLSRFYGCLLYTSPSPRDKRQSRMPSSA